MAPAETTVRHSSTGDEQHGIEPVEATVPSAPSAVRRDQAGTWHERMAVTHAAAANIKTSTRHARGKEQHEGHTKKRHEKQKQQQRHGRTTQPPHGRRTKAGDWLGCCTPG